MYDVDRLTVISYFRGVLVLHIINDAGRAEYCLQYFHVAVKQGYVVDLLLRDLERNVYASALRGFHAAYAYRKIDVAVTLRVEPIVDINRARIVTVYPHRPAVVCEFSFFFRHLYTPS